MKTSIIPLAVLSAVILLSCAKEVDTTIASVSGETELLSFGATYAEETKTVLQENGDVFWSPSDEILVINRRSISWGYSPVAYVFKSENTSDSATATFTATVSEEFAREGGYSYIAISPASAVPDQSWDRNYFTISVPSVQTAVEGSFSRDSFVSFASCRDDDKVFHFKNICGGIRFRLTKEGVSSVVLQNIGGEPLSGDALLRINGELYPNSDSRTVELKAPEGETLKTGVWYYISTLPAELEEGYRLIFKYADGRIALKTDSAKRAIKQSVWGSLNQVDKDFKFEEHPSNEIQYTTTDGNPVTLNTEVSMWESDYTLLLNEYKDGKGRMVFDKELTYIGLSLFRERTTLKSIYLPDGIKSLEQSVFEGCSSLEDVRLPANLETVDGWTFCDCEALKSIELPESLTNIGNFDYWNTGLTSFTIGKNIQRIGVSALRHTPLTRIDVLAEYPPLGETYMLGNPEEHSFPIYVPDASANEYAVANFWCEYNLYKSDGTLIEPVIYKSTDYSRDGELIQLQEASVGKGIRVVILGDGYTDKDLLPDGPFEQYAHEAMEALFSREPLTSLRDRFDVYAVKSVSSTSYFYSKYADRALTYDNGIHIVHRREPILDYLAIAPNPHEQRTHAILLFNNEHVNVMNDRANMAYLREDVNISTITFNKGVSDHGSGFDITLLHECAGHDIGSLGDEYIEYSDPILPQETLDGFYEHFPAANNDIESDPEKVRWAHFIKDERYKEEKIGVFQGAFYQEFYRPNEDSIMSCQLDSFNAPSREAIYKYVMSASEGDTWSYDYETFVEFDKVGREYAIEAFKDCSWPPTNND